MRDFPLDPSFVLSPTSPYLISLEILALVPLRSLFTITFPDYLDSVNMA